MNNLEIKKILESDELIEKLADLEHDRWSSWFEYQLTRWDEENIERWKKLAKTPYSQLAEYSKESDRKEVRKTLQVIFDLLAEKEKEAKPT